MLQYMYSVIEKGDNLVKLVSLDEERRWLYCLLFTLLFTLHSINYLKFWYLRLDEQCLVPLFMVILYIQTNQEDIC